MLCPSNHHRLWRGSFDRNRHVAAAIDRHNSYRLQLTTNRATRQLFAEVANVVRCHDQGLAQPTNSTTTRMFALFCALSIANNPRCLAIMLRAATLSCSLTFVTPSGDTSTEAIAA